MKSLRNLALALKKKRSNRSFSRDVFGSRKGYRREKKSGVWK